MQASCLILHLFYLSAINSVYAYNDWGLQPDTSRIVKRQAKGCKRNEYKCINGQCIDNFSVCDGTKDCKDGSDETLSVCSKLSLQCQTYAFRCAYGACVDKEKKCNGEQDCADNSDELLPECKMPSASLGPGDTPPCKDNKFKCSKTGECIDSYSVCDGTQDCADGTDETITQCVNMKCPPFSWKCAYGACIEREKKCDKVNDCADGSDETADLCSPPNATTTVPTITTKPTKPTVAPPPPRGKCVLPNKPEGGNFIVTGCLANDKSRMCQGIPQTPVDARTVLNFTCKEGFALQNTEDSKTYSHCMNGVWEPPPPLCVPLCSKLISSSLDINCTYRGDSISCENSVRPGTKARPRCKYGYREDNPYVTFTEAICKLDGRWDPPLFRCSPECGQPITKNVKPLISKGVPTVIGEYPWHAGIYIEENGIWDLICGGTLISPHIILTAAHCIYVEDQATSKVRDVREIKVVVGKYNRRWDIQDPYQQTRDVSEIVLPLKYRGQSTSYSQDIALLDLVSNIILNDYVLPACIDKGINGFYIPEKGIIGSVAGWGYTEEKTLAAKLLSAHLPYIDYDSCRSELPNNFLKFITYDKFCAGYKNGTGVQQGDSGGGLTFIKNNLHFVYGIVSVKPAEQDTYATFTNVSEHIVWLEASMKALSQKPWRVQ